MISDVPYYRHLLDIICIARRRLGASSSSSSSSRAKSTGDGDTDDSIPWRVIVSLKRKSCFGTGVANDMTVRHSLSVVSQ